jgi:putative inorganic carbon (HCO3(-)) transporter
MPTSTDVGRAGPRHLVAASDVADVDDAIATGWAPADLTKDWSATLVTSAIAILPALLLSQVPMVVALAIGAAIACGLAYWADRTAAVPLVLSLVPATILANSGLMPAATYFLPTAILGLGVVLFAAARFVRTRSIPALPWRPLVAFAVLYLAAAVLSTAFSIRPATSIPYLIGIVIILVVTLWLGPWVLSSSTRIASMFALIAAAGVVMTALSLVFSLTGPFQLFGRWIGVYLVEELTISNQATGIVVLRTMGPFLAPGVQALALAPAILATLALRPGLGRRGRLVADLAVAVMVLGLLSTFARAGWLAVVVGTGLLAIQQLRSRRIDLAAAAVCAVMAIAFGGLLMNVLGANYRPDLTVARIPLAGLIEAGSSDEGLLELLPAIPGALTPGGSPGALGTSTTPIHDRGGSELSGRLEIWSASVRAIEDRPVVGFGPGTNAIALDPYLSGVSRRFVGLTSHNTWLRTWLEFGIFGIIGFAGFVVTALIAGLRGGSTTPARRSLRMGALAIFAGLAAAQGFETFLLGGVSMPSFVWSIAAGLLAFGVGGIAARETAAA